MAPFHRTGGTWAPKRFERYVEAYESSTGATRIITDLGEGCIKALGNAAGPHALVCELVGTQLADWIGLKTFDMAVMNVDAGDDIMLGRKMRALPGPAIVSRWEEGDSWSGNPNELARIENRDDLTRLVVFDTWVMNCDRYPADLKMRKVNRDNVFLSKEGTSEDQVRLIAMDQTHCFACGRDLTVPNLTATSRVNDSRLYGFFPEFKEHISISVVRDCVRRLDEFDASVARDVMREVPRDWQLEERAKNALQDLIVARARLVVDTIEMRLTLAVGRTGSLDL